MNPQIIVIYLINAAGEIAEQFRFDAKHQWHKEKADYFILHWLKADQRHMVCFENYTAAIHQHIETVKDYWKI